MWDFPRMGTRHSSWWWLTSFPNMLIPVPCHTSSLQPLFPNYSLTKCLNCVACLHPSCLIKTLHLLSIYGRNYSNFRGLSWKWALPIIHGQMGKQRKLLNDWKCTCISFPQKRSMSGFNSFLELNGGTIQHIIPPLKWLYMKLSMGTVYGKQPSSLTSYLPGTSKFQVVENILQQREWTLVTLKDNVAMDWNHMEQQTIKGTSITRNDALFSCLFEGETSYE